MSRHVQRKPGDLNSRRDARERLSQARAKVVGTTRTERSNLSVTIYEGIFNKQNRIIKNRSLTRFFAAIDFSSSSRAKSGIYLSYSYELDVFGMNINLFLVHCKMQIFATAQEAIESYHRHIAYFQFLNISLEKIKYFGNSALLTPR